MTSKHLSFYELDVPKRKTRVWEVRGYQDSFLGVVQWRAGWRCYVFTPTQGESITWSHECLSELAAFIKEQMDARRT